MLKAGDKLKDNDPRVGNRVLTVVEVYANGVVAEDSVGKGRTYSLHRIFTDGKPRRYGLSLVNGATK